jgi:hypothetical protein
VQHQQKLADLLALHPEASEDFPAISGDGETNTA